MAAPLRDRLIGAWELVAYVEHPVDGSRPFEPLGPNPQGIILYTGDGYMSAQLARPDREVFSSGDRFDGTPEEYQAAASSYVAYTGPFRVDEQAQTVTHFMFISLFPNWTGHSAPRRAELQEDILRLGTSTPIITSGETVNSALTWRRAKPS